MHEGARAATASLGPCATSGFKITTFRVTVRFSHNSFLLRPRPSSFQPRVREREREREERERERESLRYRDLRESEIDAMFETGLRLMCAVVASVRCAASRVQALCQPGLLMGISKCRSLCLCF